MNPFLPLIRPLCTNFGAFRLARSVDDNFPVEVLSPPQTIERKLPILLDEDAYLRTRFEKHLKATLDPLVFTHIPKGWITADGSHISKENRLIKKLSMHYTQTLQNHPALNTLRPFHSVKHFHGRLLALTGKGHHNYYHWMTQILPKWGILKKYSDENALTTVIYAPETTPFQRRSLEIIGAKNILDADKNHVVYADEIIGASIPQPEGNSHPAALNYVRSLFLTQTCAQTSGHKNIFISRQDASVRRIENFGDVEKWCAKNNFTIVKLEALPIDEQANIFRNAAWVIAPHGAGLTNLMFCSPGARVIEIVGDDKAHPEPTCFWVLSEVLNLHHGYLAAAAIPHPDQKRKAHEKDYRVDIGKLERLYRKMETL